MKAVKCKKKAGTDELPEKVKEDKYLGVGYSSTLPTTPHWSSKLQLVSLQNIAIEKLVVKEQSHHSSYQLKD